MVVVFGEVIRNSAQSRVDIRPAQIFCADIFTCRGFDERRSAEEDRARAFDDDGFVAHRRDVRAARRATAHHRRDLRNLFGGHARLVVEDATEVIEVGEDLVLKRQKCPARIDEIQAGQVIFLGDLLGAQMLFDRHREVRSAFDGGIVGDDEHFAVPDAPDAGDDACARRFKIVHADCRERGEFEEWRARVEQAFNAVAHEEFAL